MSTHAARRAALRRLAGVALASGMAACGGGGGGGGDGGSTSVTGTTAAPTSPPQVPVTAPTTPPPAPGTDPVPGANGRRVIDVRAAGAVGDGVALDRSAIAQALATAAANPGSDVYFPPGEYWLGTHRGQADVLVLDGARDVRIIGNDALLVCRSAAGINDLLVIQRSSDVWIHGMAFHDPGLNRRIDWQGANAILLDGDVPGGVQRVRVTACRFNSVLSALTAGGRRYDVRDIVLERLAISLGYYGFLFQDNGHQVRASDIVFDDLKRSYFAYGVDDHVINFTSRVHTDGSNEFLVKCYDRDTSNIVLDGALLGRREGESIVVLEHEHVTASGVIRNVRFRLDLASATCAPQRVFLLRSYLPADQSSPEAVTRSAWRDLTIDGNFGACGAGVPFFQAQSTPLERALVRIGPGVDPRLIPDPPPAGFDFVRVA